MIIKKKFLPFFSLLAVLMILVTHELVSASTPILSYDNQCSIWPVELIHKSVKDEKAPQNKDEKASQNNAQLTPPEIKPIPLVISEVFVNEKGNKLNQNEKKSAALSDSIRVTIDGLADAIDHGQLYAIDPVTQKPSFAPFNYQSLVLQLKGYSLNGLVPTRLSSNDKNSKNAAELEFTLTHLSDSNKAWSSILNDVFNFHSDVEVSVGCPNGQAILLSDDAYKKNNKFNYIEIRNYKLLRGFIVFFSILFTTISLIFLSINTAILRSSGITKNRCYSLARVQLAWWSYIIIVSFLVLFGVTGEFSDILTTQSLILLGIGTGTTFISSLIDSGNAEKVRLSDAEIDTIKKLEEDNNKKELNHYELQSTGKIWEDILTDTNGEHNVHRAQIIVWSVILGLIFIYQVTVNFKFPEFDETLLTLQGISSATFLGLKAQSEKKKSADEVAEKQAEADEAAKKQAEADEAAKKQAEADEAAKKQAEADEAANHSPHQFEGLGIPKADPPEESGGE